MVLRILRMGSNCSPPNAEAGRKRTERSRELLEGGDTEPRHDGGSCEGRSVELAEVGEVSW